MTARPAGRTPLGAQAPTQGRDRAETVRQAARWDTTANSYRRAGFSHADAAQAAWGHQCGFLQVQPVRDCCRGRRLPDRHDVPSPRRWVTRGGAGT